MKPTSILRRNLVKLIGVMLAFSPVLAAAQGRPVEWVVGYATGGGSDVVARIISAQMAQALGRPIIVNNKPGAATTIAAGYVAKSKDIGNIMLAADFATLAANPHLFAKLPYDAEKDFKPVGLFGRVSLLLVVNPNVPAKDFKQFVSWVQSTPDGVPYASSGIGTAHHLAMELLRERTGLKLQHVAYRSSGQAVHDIVTGQIQFAMMDVITAQQYLSNGKLRALGAASATRLAALPDVPTLAEQGLNDFEASAWQGLVVPADTPAPIIADMAKALQSALRSPTVLDRLNKLSMEPLSGTPEQMAEFVRSERERWGKLIRANGIKLD